MKRFFAAITMAVMTFSATALADVTEVNVVVNDAAIETKGIIVDSTTLVPVRGVFEELGFDVSYDAETKTAVLENSRYTVSLTDGESVIYVNDEEITPPVAQQIYEGHFMLPLRTVAEAIGADVAWDAETKTASVTKKTGLKIGGVQTLS